MHWNELQRWLYICSCCRGKNSVEYRYFKNTGITIKDNKKENFFCKMYVRDLNLNLETKIHKDLDKILKKKKNIINKIFLKQIFL